ncbi:MAG: secretin N-terminal domain-containing protein, partial [Pirellulaceae bacterium]
MMCLSSLDRLSRPAATIVFVLSLSLGAYSVGAQDAPAESPAQPAEKPAPPAETPAPAEKPADAPAKPTDPDPAGKPAAPAMPPAEVPAEAATEPPPEPEKTLRFTFRFQKWVDVLEWFAEQAGLSLVIDNPPPGTFNYSDTKEYTVTESIDLLNEVLTTKGYTLIRRDRMLLVLNKADGIPADAVPRVTIEELENRAPFELVSVMLSLGRRDPAMVSAEISHLLSPLGTVVTLLQTKQMLVMETAGIMRSINQLLETIPEPPEPKPKPEPAVPYVPKPPLLAVYPATSFDPAKAIEALQILFEGAKFVVDEKASQISAYATPKQHEGIDAILKQMAANNPPDKQARLEVYEVKRHVRVSPYRSAPSDSVMRRLRSTSQLIESLQLVVPDMNLTFDETRRKLIAWGEPKDHEKLQETLAKLELEPSSGGPIQVEVFPLTKVEPENMETLLQNLFPNTDLAVDSASRILIVAASPEEMLAVRNIIEQLQPSKPGPNSPELRVYLLKKVAPSDLTILLTSVAPTAQVTLTQDGMRLLAVASPADQALIQKTIEQLEEGVTPEVKNAIKFFSVSPAQRKRFDAVVEDLTSELPGMRVVADAEPGELAIWATPQQHAVLVQVLEELKREVPEEERYRLFTFPLARETATSVAALVVELHP